MERITYFKIFGFLASMGAAFLSTTFYYPAFTVSWFIVMILFVAATSEESSEMIILAFSVLAYIPLGLISILSDYVSKGSAPQDISNFAWLLITFVIIELTLAIAWMTRK